LLRAGGSKADEIDDCIRLELGNARAESPGYVLRCPVDLDAPYCVPCSVWYIRLAISAAGDDYLMASVNEPRNEKRPDMASGTDEDNSHCAHMLALIRRCRINETGVAVRSFAAVPCS
jgi:hypothetical protein